MTQGREERVSRKRRDGTSRGCPRPPQRPGYASCVYLRPERIELTRREP